MQSIPFIPSYDQALTNIKSICSSHFMNGCQTCNLENPADCDLLLLYSQLCKSMPYMSQCSNWKSMCSSSSPFSVSSWNELCPSSDRISSDPPIMRMYFHTGIIDYVLFESKAISSTV